MEKYIYNGKNCLWYELQGDYYLPCLKLRRKPRYTSASGENGTGVMSFGSTLPSVTKRKRHNHKDYTVFKRLFN